MLAESFKQHIASARLFDRRDKLLLGVSGGVDSVVLCELCRQCALEFSVAHVNFGLRGHESDEDENFVRNLAAQYGVEIDVARLDAAAHAREAKVSVQVAARELRYTFFNKLAEEKNALIVTAHHADDNIETVLMNFFRGTGIRGLRGIPAKIGRIRRPLLPFTKQQILQFAKSEGLAWREDSSNTTNKYSRNYFRNLVIPSVTAIFPEAEHNLLENINRFREAEILYNQAIDRHKKSLIEKKENEVHVPVLKLMKSEPVATILYEIAKPFGFTASQLNELVHLLRADHGKIVYSATHRAIRNRQWLIFSPREPLQAENIIIEKTDDQIKFRGGAVTFSNVSGKTIQNSAGTNEYFDEKNIEYPLILRKWKAGDYFYPLGMNKKKKVSRFLIDLKLSRSEKENTWVLESGKRICCILGRRIDDRFKVDENTRGMLRINFTPSGGL